jgi:hypothetical protein
LSGVLRSSFKISLGGFVGGGSAYRFAGEELLLLEVGVEPSKASLLASDFGGVGGNRRLVSGNSVPGFFVCASIKGGGSGTAVASVDMICGGIKRL